MSGDEVLIRIVDAAMAEAARKSGPWLVCRSGCTECCMGPFPITQLDARRLREGLIACRIFGPLVRCGSGAMGVCELCFQGAGNQEIATWEVEIDPRSLESRLPEELERTTGARGQTMVAFALVTAP